MAKSGLKRQKSKTRTLLEEDGLHANGRQDSPNSSKRVRWDVTSDTLDDPPPSPQKEQVDLDISLSDKVCVSWSHRPSHFSSRLWRCSAKGT